MATVAPVLGGRLIGTRRQAGRCRRPVRQTLRLRWQGLPTTQDETIAYAALAVAAISSTCRPLPGIASARHDLPPSAVPSSPGPNTQPAFWVAMRISVIPGSPECAIGALTRPSSAQCAPSAVPMTAVHVDARHGTVPSTQPLRGVVQVIDCALNAAGTRVPAGAGLDRTCGAPGRTRAAAA